MLLFIDFGFTFRASTVSSSVRHPLMRVSTMFLLFFIIGLTGNVGEARMLPETDEAPDCEIEYVVFNADDDTQVGLLDEILREDGELFCIPDHEVNIQARPTPECPATRSARMDLHGPVSVDNRLENAGPYMIFGDNNQDPINYFGRNLLPGSYTIDSDIFSEKRGQGDLVVSRKVHFEAKVCDEKPPKCADRFFTLLSGEEEVPLIQTGVDGEASFQANYDGGKHGIDFHVSVRDNGEHSGLLGAAGAHIHCAPEGANGPVVAFLAGVVLGGLVGEVVFKGTLTDANIIDQTCGESTEELLKSFCDGGAYVNVHSLNNPSGEVRGQIHPEY